MTSSSINVNEDCAALGDRPTSPLTNTGERVFTPTAIPTPMRRGPGRPRLKTGGPVNQGMRGAPRTRKPIGPLVVPLGNSPVATPLNRSPAMSPAHVERSCTNGITSPAVIYYQSSGIEE